MKKLDNFARCLKVLEKADFKLAAENEIYRMGVIGQYSLTFELAWKAMQSVLRIQGVSEAETGSPREIILLGYRYGFIDDSEVWLLIMKKRNTLAHVYDEEEADELLLNIRDSFIPAFQDLKARLEKKMEGVG